jgi:phosphoglycolate phosphatase-like HAD superfamily hydrolase
MAIIAFDLDGTLITVDAKQSYSLRAVARRFGVAVDCRAIWERKREGLSNARVLLALGVNERTAANISSAWQREIETPYWLSLDVPFADCFKCLAKIRQRGDQCVLVTARSNQYIMRQQVLRLGLENHFTAVFCVEPAFAVEQKAGVLKNVGARAYFGDSETDFESAKRAGVPFFAVSTGQRSENFLNRHGITGVDSSLSNAVDREIQGAIP